ncbi:enoyl-CoA hydratase domain-containing protein 3, mitochondrial isoform X3 [Paramormyrops kingsleyae]|uniref:enoyl-CoA hydratase domain-containing protein 3, mitochondrial isoform X3 n=1 Tax=Paramormyrops kingsleyae TaxID=1676925 RepID=UPI003B97B30C
MALRCFSCLSRVVRVCQVLSRAAAGSAAVPVRSPTLRRQEGGIRTITLNDPKKRNALSLSMLTALRADLLADIDSEELRVIIISAEGPVFSSGHDLKELTSSQGKEYHRHVFGECSEVTMEMLLTGEPISAQAALLHGLVSRVVPEEQLDQETLAIAQRVCQTSRSVVALGKATFYKQMALGRETAYGIACAAMVDNLALRDGQEGVQAFLGKRKPVWTHSTEKVSE